MPSDNVGWANIVSLTCEIFNLHCIAKVKIPINSVARGPIIEAPRTWFVLASEIILMKPSVSSNMRAIPEPKKSNFFGEKQRVLTD